MEEKKRKIIELLDELDAATLGILEKFLEALLGRI